MSTPVESPQGHRETVGRCWCSKAKRQFGVVLNSRESGVWEIQHAYSVNDSYKEAECRQESIVGSVHVSDTYNGCKWCSNTDIFQCGQCKILNCQGVRKRNTVRCAHCGNAGELYGHITSLSVSMD